MLPDYYNILGIAPESSVSEIKAAYRKKALKCHPDRGGSHEKMLEINEAFECLSNASTRSQYDYARLHQQNQDAQIKANTATARAREQAGNYPRDWASFETWLDQITNDFHRAEYGQIGGLKDWSLPFPTAGKSITGWVFIIGGAIIGFAIVPHGPFGVLIGAWLGSVAHKAVKSKLNPIPTSLVQSNPSGNRIYRRV